MRQSVRRMYAVLILAMGMIVPRPALSVTDDPDSSGRSTAVLQCAERLEKWFPLITVQTAELDLDHVKIVAVEGHQINIPLKKPRGQVKTIYFRMKEMNEALDMIRLLQHGKIGAVNLLPFRQDPAGLYQMRRDLMVDMKGCQNREQILEVLGQCTDCLVREWSEIKP